jgi:hypothetical protein
MRKSFYLIIIALFISITEISLAASMSPIGLGIFPPVQFPPSDYHVTGLRLNPAMGFHNKVYGVDFGLIGNGTKQDFTGLAVAGGYNYNAGSTTVLGLQAALGANINKGKSVITGIQAAAVNSNEGATTLVGLQLGVANLSAHSNVYGVQAGLYNRAKEVYGVQIGVFNSCDNLHGLQIGLINHHDKGTFKYVPVLNFGF